MINDGKTIIEAVKNLHEKLEKLQFPISEKVIVYNVFDNASVWEYYCKYVKMYGTGCKDVLIVGMNPSPNGMARTGVPFGTPDYVKDFLGLDGIVQQPIAGYPYKKTEGSGKNLWFFLKAKFQSVHNVFEKTYIDNYCPLIFLNKDRTSTYSLEDLENCKKDLRKLDERKKESLHNYMSDLYELCDLHIQKLEQVLNVTYVVPLGDFMLRRMAEARNMFKLRHPSMRGRKCKDDQGKTWAEIAQTQAEPLIKAEVWPSGLEV